ncbi:centrosomal protein of 89 kDa-like isoform X2 [Gigantopelta aegis]|uniref:centrosomal protein of 89 kDa-like isoform X2 n=1 Tax=Gigantopelta aegis TaxID=1735272 RepID=UPI001B88A8BC|nr:centrosomal protein of 89 kDa-like isoform X2 [Gigantopelta aegis]
MPLLGKRGKRKKSRSAGMSHIGGALVPSAIFAAVPKTPPPTTPPGTGVGLAGSLSNVATLGRLFAEPMPLSDDDPLSDPESSLYDYQQMEEAGYVSVDFGSLPRRGRSISERQPATTPKLNVQNNADETERQMITDIYATPHKGRYRQNQKESPDREGDYELENLPASLGGTTHDVRKAMQAVHDLSPYEETLLKQQVDRKMHTSPQFERGSYKKGIGSKRSSGRHSHKLSDEKGHISPDGRQLGPVPRPEQDADSGFGHGDTINGEVADSPSSRQFVTKTEPQYSASSSQHLQASGHVSSRLAREGVQDLTRSLQMKVEELQEDNQHLQEEVMSLRKVAAAVNEGDTESAQSLLVSKQMKELRDENEVMKTSVHRLNMELSNHQAKKIPLSVEQCRKIEGLPAKGPIPSWLISKRYLAPLFVEYDDRLQEKDDIILKYQEELHDLKLRVEEIVRENGQLQMAASGAGFGTTEWQQIQDQARLVLEENQLLIEQLNVQQNKARDMYEAHTQEVSRLTKKLSAADYEKTEVERELEETKLKMRELKHKLDSMMLNSQANIPVQEHINAVADVKRTVAEEKEILLKEREIYEAKLKAAEDERRSLCVKLTDAEVGNKRLHVEIDLLHKAVRRTQYKLLVFQKAMEQSEFKELSTQDQLANIIKVAEMTAAERDTYVKMAKEQQQESKKAMNTAFASSVAIGRLEEKLKLYKMKAAAKFNTVTERMKYQDESFNSRCQEYEREIKYLRLLLQEKELSLQSLQTEKREIETDLECMWQAASSENVQIKDTLRKCLRKLREHSAFSKILDNDLSEKHGLLNLSEDDES